MLTPPPGLSEDVDTVRTEAPPYVVRELRNEEWDRLAALPPWPDGPLPEGFSPDPANSLVMIAETPEGEIIAYWSALNVIHMEGFWVSPEHRHKHPRLIHRLVHQTRTILDEAGIPVTFCWSDRPEISDYMSRIPLFTRLNVDTFAFTPLCPSPPPSSPQAPVSPVDSSPAESLVSKKV